jgi:hypothetical protein
MVPAPFIGKRQNSEAVAAPQQIPAGAALVAKTVEATGLNHPFTAEP